MQELNYSTEHRKRPSRFAISSLLLALTTPILNRVIRSVDRVPDLRGTSHSRMIQTCALFLILPTAAVVLASIAIYHIAYLKISKGKIVAIFALALAALEGLLVIVMLAVSWSSSIP